MTLDFQSYLADIYEQSEHIMEAAGRMTYEEFLGDALYSAGIIRDHRRGSEAYPG